MGFSIQEKGVSREAPESYYISFVYITQENGKTCDTVGCHRITGIYRRSVIHVTYHPSQRDLNPAECISMMSRKSYGLFAILLFNPFGEMPGLATDDT